MKIKTKEIAIIGILIAMAIVFSRVLSFSFPPGQVAVKVTVSFIVPLIGIWFGPIIGLVSGALTDFLGFFMFPGGQEYNFGFTINEALQGFIPGLIFLYIRRYKPSRFLVVPFILAFVAFAPFSIAYTVNRGSFSTNIKVVFIVLQIIITLLLILAMILLMLKQNKNKGLYSITNVILMVLPVKILVSYILTPIWMSMFYNKSFIVYLPARFIISPLNIALAIFFLYVVLNRLTSHIEELKRS